MSLKQKKLAAYAKILLIFIITVITLWLLYFCFEGIILDYINNSNYHAAYLSTSGYSEELGVPALEYECFQEVYGSSINRVRERSIINPDAEILHDEYSGFITQSTEVTDVNGIKLHFTSLIIITSENFHFGWLRIGIGSSRALVHLAYLLDQKIEAEELIYSAAFYPDVDDGYYGDDWSRILFCYANDGKVESMAFEPPPF